MNQPPRGSGNGRLAAAAFVMAPALGATYAQALLARRRFADTRAIAAALRTLGIDDLARGRTIEASVLGSGKSNAVVGVRLVGGGEPRRLVLKRALAFGTLMAWGARNFGANYVYAAATSGVARIGREARALRFLAEHDVAVPSVLAADAARKLIALQWIDGRPAATALHETGGVALAKRIGALVRRVHELGVTLGDGHPGNMMLGETGLVLFDLEFAECEHATPARRGFDLAYAAVLMPTLAHVDAMLDGYGDRSSADRAAFSTAEEHLRRFGTLLEMERKRWVPR
jgi:tRNA A-37 threonylcarbamoyl transferase component Bud32